MHEPSCKGKFFPIILTDLNRPWEKMLHLGTRITFAARCLIPQRKFSSNTGMYLMRRGLVKLSYISLSGDEKALLYIGRGTLFHETPMLHDAYGCTYTFTCIEPTEFTFFPKKILTLDFVRQHPELILNMLESFSIKTTILYSSHGREGSFNVFTKTCRVLYSMYLFNNIAGVVVPRISRQELASFLGIHRSSLHKALRRLHDEGVIGAYSKKKLTICNIEPLQKYALEVIA
jgi:CRP-like cAMP-binding protein